MIHKSLNKTKERQRQYDIAYMKMAEAFATLSYAKRKQVGAIIVSKNDQVISQGFNGTPHGFSNICEEILFADNVKLNLDNDIEKFNAYADNLDAGTWEKMSEIPYRLKTKPEVLHAETNAITKCAKYSNSTEGATLYVTLAPCLNCAKLIVQAEIARVVYKEYYNENAGLNFLRSCGVEVVELTY